MDSNLDELFDRLVTPDICNHAKTIIQLHTHIIGFGLCDSRWAPSSGIHSNKNEI